MGGTDDIGPRYSRQASLNFFFLFEVVQDISIIAAWT
jgi:hypothetical protein